MKFTEKIKAIHRKGKIDKIRTQKVQEAMKDFNEMLQNASNSSDSDTDHLPKNISVKKSFVSFIKKPNRPFIGKRIEFENDLGENIDTFEYYKDANMVKVIPTETALQLDPKKEIQTLNTSNGIKEYFEKLEKRHRVPDGEIYRHRDIVVAEVNGLLSWAKEQSSN